MRSCFIGFILVGLAVGLPAGAAGDNRLSDRALDLNQNRIRLNVQGGYYSEVEVKAQKSQDFVLMLDHPNHHEKWGSTAWVCLVEAKSEKRICTNLFWPDPTVDRLVVEQSDKTGKDVTQRVQLGSGYFIDQEVRLTLRISDGEAQFQVGDEVVKRPLDFKPERVTLGCSSAECIFTQL